MAVAAALREIAALLEAGGADRFRVRAYERGARALEASNLELPVLVREGRLRDLPGIGPALARTITELVQSGRSTQLDELRAALPPGLIELRQVPHLTPHRIAALQRALAITSVEELKQAALEGRLAGVRGFGPATVAAVLDGIRQWETRGEALLLHEAQREGETLLELVRSIGPVRRATLAGALRRGVELVDRISIAVSAPARDAPAVLRRLVELPPVASVVGRKRDRCSLRLAHGVFVEARVMRPERAGAALIDATGSATHVEKLRAIARERGLALHDDVLRDARGRALRTPREADVYAALGLPLLPPELRDDEGEIEAALAGRLETRLVEERDIRGMVHCHTRHSDGRDSVLAMAQAAEAMGMEYLTITDHSPTAHYARGVTVDRLQAQWDEIDRAQERVRLKILRGTESDILADGSLDYPDAVLERLDVVIASIHQRHKMDATAMTRRLVAAMRHPLFKIWGHGLGRYVRSRPPIECRVEEVLDAAAASRVAIEVNGDPHRLDLEPRWQREARKRGLPFVVSTDAHSVEQLKNLRFGIAMARRGWLTPPEVLNTRDADAFRAAVRPA